MEMLEAERKLKAKEILNVLLVKGHKKIGKEKIKDMLAADPETLDYDLVIEFYQGVLRK